MVENTECQVRAENLDSVDGLAKHDLFFHPGEPSILPRTAVGRSAGKSNVVCSSELVSPKMATKRMERYGDSHAVKGLGSAILLGEDYIHPPVIARLCSLGLCGWHNQAR